MWWAQARPKTTMSKRELAPRRLAPWTETHAASPAAYSPGTTLSLPFYHHEVEMHSADKQIYQTHLVDGDDLTGVLRGKTTH